MPNYRFRSANPRRMWRLAILAAVLYAVLPFAATHALPPANDDTSMVVLGDDETNTNIPTEIRQCNTPIPGFRGRSWTCGETTVASAVYRAEEIDNVENTLRRGAAGLAMDLTPRNHAPVRELAPGVLVRVVPASPLVSVARTNEDGSVLFVHVVGPDAPQLSNKVWQALFGEQLPTSVSDSLQLAPTKKFPQA